MVMSLIFIDLEKLKLDCKIILVKSKKIVPLDLKNLITALALAVWISDDGTRANGRVRISLNNFTLNEVLSLAYILKSQFQLDVTISKMEI